MFFGIGKKKDLQLYQYFEILKINHANIGDEMKEENYGLILPFIILGIAALFLIAGFVMVYFDQFRTTFLYVGWFIAFPIFLLVAIFKLQQIQCTCR